MANGFDAGLAFKNFLGTVAQTIGNANPFNAVGNAGAGAFNAGANAGAAVAPGIGDFQAALTGAPRSAVTVPYADIPVVPAAVAAQATGLPAAAAQAHANGQAMTAADIMHLGSLSPGAQAVLQANSPKTLAAAQTAQNATAAKKTATAPAGLSPADMKALGALSFRQLGMLGDLALKTSPAKDIGRGAVTSTADLAAQQMLGLNQPQFEAALKGVDANKTLTQQDKDAQKQKLIKEYSTNTLLPIMARGNDPLAQVGALGQQPGG